MFRIVSLSCGICAENQGSPRAPGRPVPSSIQLVGVPRGCVVRTAVAAPVVVAPVVVAPAAGPVVVCKTRGVPKGCVMR